MVGKAPYRHKSGRSQSMGKKPENKASSQVNEEDRELFRQAMQGTRPIQQQDKVAPHRQPPAAHVTTHRFEETIEADGLSDEMQLEGLETADELFFARTGIQHSVIRKLRRGHYPIEDELDLHGLRSDDARTTISRFLNAAAQRQLRCVRIIHGKGYGSQSRQPVLKNKVNNWLRQRSEVLAFCSARPADGGTGAIYLLLKR